MIAALATPLSASPLSPLLAVDVRPALRPDPEKRLALDIRVVNGLDSSGRDCSRNLDVPQSKYRSVPRMYFNGITSVF